MSSSSNRKKSVSLTFRGFNKSAEDVTTLFDVAASRIGNRGEPVKSGVKTLLTRSYVIFSMDFENDFDLNDMFPELLMYMGGANHLLQIRNEVQPEFLEIHFDLPVKESEDSQEGYLSDIVISDVFLLKASISFGFF